jgi:Cu/Ag efflux protein CusF
LNAKEIPMKRLIALAASLFVAMSALAQGPLADGEVTKIDKAQGKITLRHGEIKSMDMPPMTMAYRVRDPKMLDSVAVGDKVRFAAEKAGGNFTVTAITKAP